MVKVTLMTGIQSMSGTLNKKSKTRIVFTTRKAPSKNKGVTRMYIRSADSYKRSTPPTEKELLARYRFVYATKVAQYKRIIKQYPKTNQWREDFKKVFNEVKSITDLNVLKNMCANMAEMIDKAVGDNLSNA